MNKGKTAVWRLLLEFFKHFRGVHLLFANKCVTLHTISEREVNQIVLKESIK